MPAGPSGAALLCDVRSPPYQRPPRSCRGNAGAPGMKQARSESMKISEPDSLRWGYIGPAFSALSLALTRRAPRSLDWVTRMAPHVRSSTGGCPVRR